MKIAESCVVSIHYTLTNSEGETLDSSAGGDPLAYLHGAGGLIPGLERELEGKEQGDQFKATIQPADAYGEANPGLIQEVPLDALSGIENLAVGMQLQSQSPDGRTQLLVVEAIGEETATLNANHALAGVVLHFDVEIAGVRAATEEELAHGHAH
ncbi:MAG: peptidylprolyl isomerase [Gammaproteobacteria bacterium]|jgi:FKBP-type peptidyl-prolyl cis-trans isomerase SlyD|nr:MAG: peptidylprolyl isomerase [Gammaproteobacteria bacterium]